MSLKENLQKFDKKNLKELFLNNILSIFSGIFLIAVIFVSIYLTVFLVGSFTSMFAINENESTGQVAKFDLDQYNLVREKINNK